MTDVDIGHSAVITKFLDFIYPNLWVDLDDGLLDRRVIRLARKWECLYALDRIGKEILLRTITDTSREPNTSLFITAVGLEDPALLGAIVAKTGHRRWPAECHEMDYICDGIPEATNASNMGIGTPFLYNFGCWSEEEFTSIPLTVLWCFHRAYREQELLRKRDWAGVAVQFHEQLQQTCEWS